MQIFDKEKKYNFMGVRHIFLAISLFLVLGSIVSIFTKGINYGIDFAGGTLVQIKYDKAAPISQIRETLDSLEAFKSVSVTEFGSKEEVTVRYSGSNDSLGADPGKNIAEILKDTGNFEIRMVSIVGPKVGGELRKKGIMALSVSLILILIYIAFRFEWRFSLAAIVAEIHDVIIAIGVISFFQIDVNLDTLAAILTIIGYSLNDTIIVFDRIRENIQDTKEGDLATLINSSLSQTLSRTILTSFTTLIAVVILFVFGGDMIHDFSFIMLIGVIVGTLSSIFIGSQGLLWLKFSIKDYREMLAAKKKREKEKERMRAMYEKGVV
ncbi:protein-export membrane protein SecF [Campylobacter blaseri]|uniref:Protein-export membrane protein SecF n=1 Tax=Campylobacter blaseri TaxID=2042961 RepID=A0A2P8R1Y5_9BACT|nr:protein translocase subunit SecF [Campylobacter blaseri]PSM52507.1 protein translocase subunit SecF [Campylobacter blaseri]PSM54155.1 protein translocase subunit SecF [Campylobacter blaseri]QKF85803.1 protein-export membrane protein SecF [Campylobacter blaseri]